MCQFCNHDDVLTVSKVCNNIVYLHTEALGQAHPVAEHVSPYLKLCFHKGFLISTSGFWRDCYCWLLATLTFLHSADAFIKTDLQTQADVFD